MIPGIGTLINSFAVMGVGLLSRLFIKKEIKNFENNLLPLGLLVLTLGIRESQKSPEFLVTLFAVNTTPTLDNIQLEEGTANNYSISSSRPLEGDLIFFPMVDKLFEIKY